MDDGSSQQYYTYPYTDSSPYQPQNPQSIPQLVNAPPPPMDAQYTAPPNQQQQYAAYIHQRYYAQQQYLVQQRQYAAYQYSVHMRQRQQHQYSHYYQQVSQQYGYPAMMQAMNQMNPAHNINHNHINQQRSHDRPSGSIILSSEEQPALIAPDHNKYKRRRRKKRKKPESDDEDNDDYNSDEDGYDKHTLINQHEILPDIETEFDDWLYFTKKLWKRQKKYKDQQIINSNKKVSQKNHKKDVLDLTESLSISDNLSESESDALQLTSTFLGINNICDSIRNNQKHKNVLKNRRVINIMIKMGLAPPWSEMQKYKKWKKCHQWNT